MAYLMDGNGSMVLTHSQQTEATEQSVTLTEMACQTCRNIPTYNLQAGTIQQQPEFLTTVYGGMEQFQSTIGTKRIPCNSTNQIVAILVVMDRATQFCAMKILLETSVRMVLTTTRMVNWMDQIQITTVMLIVLLMTMMEMVL